MGWPCQITGGLKVTWGRDLSLKGRARSLSDCSLAYSVKQFAFCEPFQKNLWESVNCTCSIKGYQLNIWMLFYSVTLMASRFVNNYRGKNGYSEHNICHTRAILADTS
jgi:hypothetical protein